MLERQRQSIYNRCKDYFFITFNLLYLNLKIVWFFFNSYSSQCLFSNLFRSCYFVSLCCVSVRRHYSPRDVWCDSHQQLVDHVDRISLLSVGQQAAETPVVVEGELSSPRHVWWPSQPNAFPTVYSTQAVWLQQDGIYHAKPQQVSWGNCTFSWMKGSHWGLKSVY